MFGLSQVIRYNGVTVYIILQIGTTKGGPFKRRKLLTEDDCKELLSFIGLWPPDLTNSFGQVNYSLNPDVSVMYRFGSRFSSYWVTDLLPREVLNLLSSRGYKVISTTGVGQTFVATLFKPDD